MRGSGARDAGAAAAALTWGVLASTEIDTHAEEALAEGIGGFVLQRPNINSPDQVRALIRGLRKRAHSPLRVAIDQEGGHVVRLAAPLTRFPGNMAIGATGSPRLAFEAARASACELAALGIDVVLAPVLDVALDPDNPTIGARSFGSDPVLVARLGGAAVRGYLAGGVAPVGKHFPGHGRTAVDTHVGRASASGGLPVLRRVDLPPFEAAIAAGVPALMASHVVYDGLTNGLPATLSPRALRRLARSELRFDGVLVTDAMVMDAIADVWPVEQACVAALVAGADVVMPLASVERTRHAVRAVEHAVESGLLSATHVAQANARLATFDRLIRLRRAAARRERLPYSVGDHRSIALDVARRSLTLLHDDGVLPLRKSTSVTLVELLSRRASPVEGQESQEVGLARAFATRLPRLRHVSVAPDDRVAALAAVRAARSTEVTIVATRDAYTGARDRELLASLARTGKPIVRVALRSPADLALPPRPATAIAAYSDVPVTCRALADALVTGSAAFPGSLPMALPLFEEKTAA